MGGRVITTRMEEAYRLCSHHFEGLSIEKAAARMGIAPANVWDLLANMRKIAPQLFPILTPAERAALVLADTGAKINEIAAGLGLSTRTVDRIVAKLKAIGEVRDYKKPIAYLTIMDNKVVEKF